MKRMASVDARRPSARTPTRRPRGSSGLLGVALVGVVGLALVVGGFGWARGDVVYAAWWLTNQTPPSVSITAPAGVVRGTISVAPHERALVVAADVDGHSIAVTEPLMIDTTAFPDGSHRLSVTV